MSSKVSFRSFLAAASPRSIFDHCWLLVVTLPLALCTSVCYSASPDDSKPIPTREWVLSNIVNEFAECGSYYSIVSVGMKLDDPEVSEQYGKWSELMTQRALTIAKSYRSSEMALKLTDAKLRMFVESMMAEIENDMTNGAILIDKYSAGCNEIASNPAKAIDSWMKTLQP